MEGPHRGPSLADLRKQFAGAVGAAVVDKDDLERAPGGAQNGIQLFQQRQNVLTLVENGDDDGKLWPLEGVFHDRS